MADYNKLAGDIISAVGGTANVSSVTHCMTRLRFILKDEGLADIKTIEAMPEVIKVMCAGGQVQIVIGPTVDKLYDQVCAAGGFEAQAAIDENLDTDLEKPKEPWSLKRLGNEIMGTMAACILPILPVFIVAGIFKMLVVLLAPGYLGLLAEDSDLMKLFALVGDAGYYFCPFYTAYTAAQRFKCSPILALLFAGIMMHPDLMQIVADGTPFTVYGIPMYPANYSSAVFPVILVVWALSYVEKFLRKHVPDMLRVLAVPVLTIAIMLPIGLCFFGPLCYVAMSLVADGLLWLTDTVGFVAIILLSILWPIVIMFGMHVPILTALLPAQLELGFDSIVYPAQMVGVFAQMAVFLGYALRAGSREKRALGWEVFVTQTFANIGEPGLYGVLLVDKWAFAWRSIGAAVGGMLCYLMSADVYIFSGVGFPFLNPLRFGPDIIPGTIACVVAALVTFALSMLFGFEGSHKISFSKKQAESASAA